MAQGVDRNRDEKVLRQTQPKCPRRASQLRASSASGVRNIHRTTPGGYQPPTIRRDIMSARCTLQADSVKDVPTSYCDYSDETLNWLESDKRPILLTGITFRDNSAHP